MNIYEEQKNQFTHMLETTFSEPAKKLWISFDEKHRSHSKELPIASGFSNTLSEITIRNLSYNFYFYYLALRLERPIPATFLGPISQGFGRIPLSGHVTKTSYHVENFEKNYYNNTRLYDMAFQLYSPASVIATLRYIKRAAELPVNEILDELFYKGGNKSGSIDFNHVDTKKIIELCGLETDKGPYSFELKNLNPNYEKIKINIYGPSIDLILTKPLHPLTDSAKVMIYPDQKHLVAGLDPEEPLPVKNLARIKDDPERLEKYDRPNLSSVYSSLPLSARKFHLKYKNALDAILGAVMLNQCMTPEVTQYAFDGSTPSQT